MGTLTISTKSMNTKALYHDEVADLKIDVNYNEDAITSTLQSLNGNVYKKSDSTYMGNFNGQLRNEEIEYSISGIKRRDMPTVYNALTDIETLIAGQNNQVEE